MTYKTGIINKLQDISRIQQFFKGFGFWGYLIFIFLFTAGCIFMIPGSIFIITAGIVFGPIIGFIVALIGQSLGATMTFLIGKYLARGIIEDKVSNNQIFKKIDDGVEENGTSFLILTRLVPVFPYFLQNYAYGLTKIKLSKYIIVSVICMLPGTFIISYMGNEIVINGFSRELIIKFTLIGISIFLISLIVKKLFKKRNKNRL